MEEMLLQVSVHLYSQSQPVIILNARNTYQKGDLYCVMQGNTAYKFPLQHIFRIVETVED